MIQLKKSKRHEKILELIARYDIDTQEELQDRLNQEGFSVTQATVSRDIKDLRLIKTASPNGGYHYTVNRSGKGSREELAFKFHAIFGEAVDEIKSAQNLVVVKCYTGMANAVCAALDSLSWPGLVGSIAGDNTILMVMQDNQAAENMVTELYKLAQ